jgi:hypothetical protein
VLGECCEGAVAEERSEPLVGGEGGGGGGGGGGGFAPRPDPSDCCYEIVAWLVERGAAGQSPRIYPVNRGVVATGRSRDGPGRSEGEFRGGDAAGESIGDGGELHRRLDEAAGGPFSLLRHERPGS